MPDAWKSYTGAPNEGDVICTLDDVPDGNTLCLEIAGFPLVLVRFGQDVKAYVNACPHQFLPLNHRGDRLMSSDKTVLRCTNHAAGFSSATGKGVEGLAVGTCLDPVPTSVVGGQVVIGKSR